MFAFVWIGFSLILLFLNYVKRLSRTALARYDGKGYGGGRLKIGGGGGMLSIGELLFSKGGRVRSIGGDMGFYRLVAGFKPIVYLFCSILSSFIDYYRGFYSFS